MLNNRIIKLIGLGCLFLAVFLAYSPSLFHVARADQLWFLAEYAGRDNSIQTLSDSLFYDRTRHFSPGNPQLFRPFFFLILTVQRIGFGYEFFYWQLVSLLAHIFSIWALWRLLSSWTERSVKVKSWAFLFVIFFAFLFANVEAVIWHHITPYVFFAGVVLVAFERMDVFVLSSGRDRGALWACSALLLMAVLTYEVGLLYSGCFFIYSLLELRGTGRVRWSLVLLMPLAMYCCLSIGHWMLMNVQADQEGALILNKVISVSTLSNFFIVLKLFLFSGFFLQPLDVLPELRVSLVKDTLSWLWPLNVWVLSRWVGAGLFVAFGCLVAYRLRYYKLTNELARILLVCAMLTGYLFMIVAGRVNVRTEVSLVNTIYYDYNFWILFTVLLFLLMGELVSFVSSTRFLVFIFSLLVIMFSFNNARNIYAFTTVIKNDALISRTFLRALDKFITEHKNESDFSFSFAADDPYNVPLIWRRNKGLPILKRSLVHSLYPQYYVVQNPKYLLYSDIWENTGHF
ncbi:MAG: hypothetical protein HQL20_02350 [Candidatus Omnitrophica bacterium]|nr:hypothetical protein [Candidatus Omnitrophota bacterium]